MNVRECLSRVKEIREAIENGEVLSEYKNTRVLIGLMSLESKLTQSLVSVRISEILEATGMSVADVGGKSRREDMVAFRYLLMNRLVEEGFGYSVIGKAVGFSHSTVIAAHKSIQNTKKYPCTNLRIDYLCKVFEDNILYYEGKGHSYPKFCTQVRGRRV